MELELRLWWSFLCAATFVNVVAWGLVARAHAGRFARWPAAIARAVRIQLALSAVYVTVCGFRSVLPRADVQRICLFDTFASSVLVGRTLATVAELCFAYQWALWLRLLSDREGVASARLISRLLVPMIVFAEISSWYAVLSTNFLGNAIEQSTWLSCGGLIALAYGLLWRRAARPVRRFVLATAPVIACFVGFMSLVDVPLYLSRWAADRRAGKVYLALAAGLRDAARRWIVEHRWQPWQAEAAWMALYFSVGVWVSIALSYGPGLLARSKVRVEAEVD